MRHDTCLTCGKSFTAPHMHPAIESAWCPECVVIMRECVMEQYANVGPCPAMKLEEV